MMLPFIKLVAIGTALGGNAQQLPNNFNANPNGRWVRVHDALGDPRSPFQQPGVEHIVTSAYSDAGPWEKCQANCYSTILNQSPAPERTVTVIEKDLVACINRCGYEEAARLTQLINTPVKKIKGNKKLKQEIRQLKREAKERWAKENQQKDEL